jgi:hypothetical protein
MFLNKYFSIFFFKFLLIKYKYLLFFNYVSNKKGVILKNKCLQLNINSYIFNANIIRLVFKNYNFKNLKSRFLVLVSNKDEFLSYNLDFDDFLFCCLNNIFLSYGLDWYNKLLLFYNNNLLYILNFIAYFYINLILDIYIYLFSFLRFI